MLWPRTVSNTKLQNFIQEQIKTRLVSVALIFTWDNIPVFQKTGATRGIKGLMGSNLRYDWPFCKLQGFKKSCHVVKIEVEVWGMYKQFEVNSKSR